MFIFDQLKREDRQLQVVALFVLLGMGVLLAGVWYIQIVSAERFKDNMQKQTFRSVRVPGLRGKILDRNGLPLAENHPRYNIDVYLEDLLARYDATNTTKDDWRRLHPKTRLDLKEINRTKQQARYEIVSNVTVRTSSVLGQPVAPSPDRFFYHLKEWTYVPFPIMRNLNSAQLALYYEQLSNEPSIDLEVQPVRSYPHGNLAAHLMGFVRSQDWPEDDDDISFQYYLPYWKGKTGLEYTYDADLRGKAGIKWVLVNNYSYRQREEMKTPAEAGEDLYLTLDLNIQKAAEKALSQVSPPTRGAVVVMDVRNGDILTMASSPSYDPNQWTSRMPPEEFARLNDEYLKPMYNRTTAAYLPGSIFKIVTSIACLESGLNPKELYHNEGSYRLSANSRPIDDEAEAGDYDFERAFYKSSNSYFINYGLKAGTRKLLEVGKRFHLGEPTELGVGPEASGWFPRPEEAAGLWVQSDLAFTSIGQKITVTPVQMACLISAIANGGTLYWPRVVSHLVFPDSGAIDPEKKVEKGRVHDVVALNPKHLDLIRHAMLMDTENPNATAYAAFFHRNSTPISPSLANFHVAGKTGTAERDEFNVRDHVTWFASYGPYENPRYAVIVMVEGGTFGGKSCAPVARQVYEAIVKSEQAGPAKPLGQIAARDRAQTVQPLN